MARIVLLRPKYVSRGEMIYYIRHDKGYLRQRPDRVHNPRTAAQVASRSAFKLMQDTLAPIRGLFSLGYAPAYKDNERKVSSYHLALGENIANAVKHDGDGVPYVDYSLLKISRGMDSLAGMRVVRSGDALTISHAPLVDARYDALLVAVYSVEKRMWVTFNSASDFHSGHHRVLLPKGWQKDTLHCYVGAGALGEQKRQHCNSQHFKLEPIVASGTTRPVPPPPTPGGKHGRYYPPLQADTPMEALAPEGARMVFSRGVYRLRV